MRLGDRRGFHRRSLAVALCLFAGLLCPFPAEAEFPERTITIVVGFSPGGANDLLARIVAEKMSASLDQSVVVLNKPGVASIIGATYVAAQKPDGYTLFMGASGPMSFNPALYKLLPYSPERDFVAISMVGTFPLLLLTSTRNPDTSSLPALIRYTKANPGICNYSASSGSFQLTTELFKRKSGIQCQYIPYKGSIEAVLAVSTGDATMALVDTSPSMPAIRGERVRALAITQSTRADYLPDTPTMKELGVDLDVELWSGLFAPAGTPAAIVKKLERAVRDALASADVRQRILQLSITPKSSTSEELGAKVKAEIALWQQVATDAGMQPN
jgi:tripartite-type tricarboxylate transporter receptor subunit TctC